MNKYRIYIESKLNGSTELDINIAEASNYNSLSIPRYPVGCAVPNKIGLLWDKTGFYRVDQDLNIISDSNFDPTTTFPFSEISTETLNDEEGVTWPLMYGNTEALPSINNYSRVWWIYDGPSYDNHVLPSFVTDSETNSKLWLKSTINDCASYNNLCSMEKNTVMNYYDYSLLQRLILLYHNTGTTPPQNVVPADSTFLDIQEAWGLSKGYGAPFYYQWIYGADMARNGVNGATAGDGSLRILNPIMDGTFINTSRIPSSRWISGLFNIENINGINMGDLMFDLSGNLPIGTDRGLGFPPFSYQDFSGSNTYGVAFNTYKSYGLFGFQTTNTNAPNLTWRSRKCIN